MTVNFRRKSEFYSRLLPLVIRNHDPVFTHGDFQQKDILVKSDGTTATFNLYILTVRHSRRRVLPSTSFHSLLQAGASLSLPAMDAHARSTEFSSRFDYPRDLPQPNQGALLPKPSANFPTRIETALPVH